MDVLNLPKFKKITAQINDITQQIALIPRIVVSETEPVDPTEGMIWFKLKIPVTDYLFRFDASHLNLTDNSKVATWEDLSENSNDLVQAVEANQPTYLATGLNSKPTVSFGGDGFLAKTPFSLSAANALTFFAVAQVDAVESNTIFGIGTLGDSGSAANAYILKVSSTNDSYQIRVNQATYANATADLNPTLIAGVFNQVNNVIYKNGVLTQTTASGNPINAHTHLQVGQSVYTSILEPLNGKISEIILYNRVLTPEEQAAMNSYLMTKWGLE